MACIFCEIVAGRAPCHKVYEVRRSVEILIYEGTARRLRDEHTLAFLDINPIAHWHTLVIPKRHVQRIEGADDQSAAALGLALKRVGRVMNDLTMGPDFNIFLANGREAGQEVWHVHYHLIPRTGRSDSLGYRWKVGRLLPQPQIDEYLQKARVLLGQQGAEADGEKKEG